MTRSDRARSVGITAAWGVGALLLIVATCLPVHAQGDGNVEISAPDDGDVLSGMVEIRGTLSPAFFSSAQLAFAYADAADNSWFGIAELSQPTTDARLALWDTTMISDGAYRLQLRLNGTDGTVRDVVIGVQVRNYTAAPTPTPSTVPTNKPVPRVDTPVVIAATPTVTRLPLRTPTPLAPNPAVLTRGNLFEGFMRGGLAIVAVFLLWGAVILRRRL